MGNSRNNSRTGKPTSGGSPGVVGKSWRWIALLTVAAVCGALVVFYHARRMEGDQRAAPQPERLVMEAEEKVFARYAGSASCQECHEEAYALWKNSHHGLAERLIEAPRDRQAFEPPRSLGHGSQSSAVGWGQNGPKVVALGLSGHAETQVVARVIGNAPLRQFLVPAAGGRFQALAASYDPGSNEWFNVNGNEERQPGEWGHWTGRGMNWNSMCAGCHNTRLRRNYDEGRDRYQTTMAEMSVGCEACHGPLKAHVVWQNQYGKSRQKDPTLTWRTRTQISDTCGSCHARRAELTADFKPGDSFLDHFEPTLVDHSELYYADGQVHEENYEYGSFLGSRMHLRGVACADCHNPHSAKTILPGNWLCLRCHSGASTNAPIINPATHSHHQVHGFDTNGLPFDFDLLAYKPKQVQESGGECVNCHMPQTAYMQRHWRHDHGFTCPDPLLTKRFNIPNACNRCHRDKDADWALNLCETWYGAKMDRPARQRSEWIAGARKGDVSAREGLLSLLPKEESSYWVAVEVGLLEPWAADPPVASVLLRNLGHTNALVRGVAARSLESALSLPGVADALRQRLQDENRNVRVVAAWVLRSVLGLDSPAAGELQQFFQVNADQPLGQMQQGIYFYSRNEPESALPHLQKAVAWDPYSPPFHHELAVVLSSLNRPQEAVETLREACRLSPRDAESHYKLGLAYNEMGDLKQTAAELERAVQLDARHDSAWYNLGLAQNALGEPDKALESLLRAETLAPLDARIPFARATILARLGRTGDARNAASRALELNPAHTQAKQLLEELSR